MALGNNIYILATDSQAVGEAAYAKYDYFTQLTPAQQNDLILRIGAGIVLQDLAGNALGGISLGPPKTGAGVYYIIYRELELSRSRINQTSPFNQALSDTGGQPIRVVVTQGGETHIMQGNHRIYGAQGQGLQSVDGLVYTPEQWEALTGSPFIPRGTNNPKIGP